MAEYIKRDTVLQYLDCVAAADEMAMNITKAVVKRIPAADVVEVRHGRWEIIVDDYDCEMMKCSHCGSEFYDGDNDTIDHLHNYCPNCGTRMNSTTN